MNNSLMSKIESISAKIGIIGLGYVGLPLAERFLKAGFPVFGLDSDNERVRSIKISQDLNSGTDGDNLNGKYPIIVSNWAALSEMDVLIICVQTPLHPDQEPDLSYLISCARAIAPLLRPQQLICLESTVYPGATEEIFQKEIEQHGLMIGRDIFLAHTPERFDPGSDFPDRSIPKIVGGATALCVALTEALYKTITDSVVSVSSLKVAETSKLFENAFRAINIGFVNEMKIICDKMNINIWEVIKAASTKPFGFMPFSPGPGMGGHCVPIDPFYFTWKSKQFSITSKFIELSGEINKALPEWVSNKIADALATKQKILRHSNVLIVGVSYKKNIDDIRESAALHVMKLLIERGAKVTYTDPYVPTLDIPSSPTTHLNAVRLTKETLSLHDCILITTDHDIFDYDLILKHSNLIVDTRGRYSGLNSNVILA